MKNQITITRKQEVTEVTETITLPAFFRGKNNKKLFYAVLSEDNATEVGLWPRIRSGEINQHTDKEKVLEILDQVEISADEFKEAMQQALTLVADIATYTEIMLQPEAEPQSEMQAEHLHLLVNEQNS